MFRHGFTFVACRPYDMHVPCAGIGTLFSVPGLCYFRIRTSEELMGESITVNLPAEIKAEVDAFIKEHGLSRSDFVRDAIREYLLVRRFHELRARMVPHAQAQGVFTDEDVFERVS
jgi:Arc/MetJ-type ribon-helix-helix transcriptional regulator